MVIKALAFPLVWPEADDEAIQALIEEIYKEKYTVAPGCATCQVPCCCGLEMAAQKALQDSGKSIPFQVVTLSIDGRKI